MRHVIAALALSLTCATAPTTAHGQPYVVATPQTAYGSPQAPYSPLAMPTAAPMVTCAAAPQIVQAGPTRLLLGHFGRKLESLSWPRVQPIAVSVPQQTQQLMYVVIQPQPQYQALPPPVQYVPYTQSPPPLQTKSVAAPLWPTPQAQQPTAPQFRATRESESAPTPPPVGTPGR
jgi:hypothetical protein